MPKRTVPNATSAPVAQKVIKKVVYNNSYNTVNHIHNYFTSQAGPTSSDQPDPLAWLPRDADATRPTRRTKDGLLFARCTNYGGNCTKNRGAGQPIANFAPVLNPRDAAKFAEALGQYAQAVERKDAEALEKPRRVLEELRTSMCDHCRDLQKKSQESGPNNAKAECKRTWKEIQASLGPCVKCGTTRCIEADHVNPATKMTTTRKDGTVVPVALSDYMAWPALGGPPAMWKEAEGVVPRCRMCHILQPTGSAGRRVATREDFEAMPDGNQRNDGTEEERKQYDAKRKASIAWPRYAYADEIKRAVGCCQNPDCPRDGKAKGDCTRGYEVCFDFDHRVEANKDCGVSKICCDARKRPDAEWKRDIRREVARSRLLCKNCHHQRTAEGLQIRERDDFMTGLTDLEDDDDE
jgi:hypothetical protein